MYSKLTTAKSLRTWFSSSFYITNFKTSLFFLSNSSLFNKIEKNKDNPVTPKIQTNKPIATAS